jgi:hypothetical protein
MAGLRGGSTMLIRFDYWRLSLADCDPLDHGPPVSRQADPRSPAPPDRLS